MTSDPLSFDAEAADAVMQPWSIWIAVRLMWTAAAVSLLVLAVGLLTAGSIKRNLADQLRDRHTYSQHNVDTLYQNLLASTIIAALLAAAVWLWMARANGAGKKWARTVATALGVVNVAEFGLSIGAGGITVTQAVLTGLNISLSIAVVVLLWLPTSSDYYYLRSRRP